MRDQQIFDAIVTLVTGLTTTGNNVFPNRQYAIPDDVENALSVRIGSDVPVDPDAYTNNAFMDKYFTVYVRIHVKSTEASIDNQIMTISREIWRAIMADTTLGLSFVFQVIPMGRADPDVDELSNKPAIQCDTEWMVHYRHSITDPGA